MCSSLGGSSRWRSRFTFRLVYRYHLEEGCILSRSYVITVDVHCFGVDVFLYFLQYFGVSVYRLVIGGHSQMRIL